MAEPIFRVNRDRATCNWCWSQPASALWVKRPESGVTKYKMEVTIPVCITCRDTIRRNHVGNAAQQSRT